MQKPIASKGTNCPLWRRDVSKVCHTCEWYVSVKGKHPQSEEMIDQWACAIAWGPMMMINVAQQAHQGAAATEGLRNELVSQIRRAAQISHTPLKGLS